MGKYMRLAVALDGSSQAEKILPLAVKLAKLLPAEVLLLHLSMAPSPAEETNSASQSEAEVDFKPLVYLARLKQRLTDPHKAVFLPLHQVLTKVAYGKLAYELGDVAVAEGADLLLMTTHGRSGLSLLTMGSIATGVLKHSQNPLLLLRPEETETSFEEALKAADNRQPNQILLTLDGTPKAEAALEPALKLAKELKIPLHLVEVIYPLTPIIMSDPGLDYKMLVELKYYEEEALSRTASQYLIKVVDWLKEQAPSLVVETTVLKGLPEAQLALFIHAIKPFVVVMATHARNELGQLFLGSVAEEVLRKSHFPVLMVPIPKGFKGYGLQVEEKKPD
jgi:nucleotide-binding universal stress UspA family protein